MPPIIISPTASSDDPSLNVGTVISKEKLCAQGVDAPSIHDVLSSDGRDDNGDDTVDTSVHDQGYDIVDQTGVDGEALNREDENSGDGDGRRSQSNLFSDEVKASSLCGNEDDLEPQSYDRPLSLMQSYSPTQSIVGGGGLDDVHVDVDRPSSQFDDFAVSILNQYNADEELARQLQEEENKKKQTFKTKPKIRVVPSGLGSTVDSLFSTPNPLELRSRSQYARVNTGSSRSSGDDDSCISSFTNWITSAAVDFFGEAESQRLQMQKKSSTARGKKDNNNHYCNAV